MYSQNLNDYFFVNYKLSYSKDNLPTDKKY